jgi:predicted RecB family endonuclease
MTTNRYSAFAPIVLKFPNKQTHLVIRNLTEAARVLIEEWPLDDGEDYLVAVKACADALTGEIGAEALRQALVSAAIEAGIPALSLVCDRAPRGAGLEPRLSSQG